MVRCQKQSHPISYISRIMRCKLTSTSGFVCHLSKLVLIMRPLNFFLCWSVLLNVCFFQIICIFEQINTILQRSHKLGMLAKSDISSRCKPFKSFKYDNPGNELNSKMSYLRWMLTLWDFPTKNGVSINDESFGCMSSEEASNKET